jgi:rare lipoprotein A
MRKYFTPFVFTLTLIVSSLLTSSVQANTKKVMTASWYGPGMQLHTMPDGRRVALTAQGIEFDMNDPTVVAHKTLPFGTELKLTHPDTGVSIKVIVQDRGPYVKGRDLDLSKGAAKKIGIIQEGEAELIVELLG